MEKTQNSNSERIGIDSKYTFELRGSGEIKGEMKCDPKDYPEAVVAVFNQFMAEWDVARDGVRIEFIVIPTAASESR